LKNGIATTLRILAVLWMLGLVMFWVVVRFVPSHGLGLPNPFGNPFDIRNSIDLVLSVIFFSIESIPAFSLLWLARRVNPRSP
jgi:hypothetical protein